MSVVGLVAAVVCAVFLVGVVVGVLVGVRRRLKLRRDRAAVLAVVEAVRAVLQPQGAVVDPLSGSRARKELLDSATTVAISELIPAQREATR
jgi:hypothetical protein